jgi:hypothetical protein
MSERVTVQGKIGRSATTNPLDERIDRYQSIGWTSRSGQFQNNQGQTASVVQPAFSKVLGPYWHTSVRLWLERTIEGWVTALYV